ncbi:MAG: MBG domain-containing protein, partial [Verrucomicrobia bacterium]|nr:MBG domain-containing protein [Verrucomicrobiota bacterium]
AAVIPNASGVAVAPDGSLYVADGGSYGNIYKITTNGVLSVFAGPEARMNRPYRLAVDRSGNVFVAESSNSRILKFTPEGAMSIQVGPDYVPVAGWVDGGADVARLNSPYDLVLDGSGNIFVADSGNYRVRKISPLANQAAGTAVGGFVDVAVSNLVSGLLPGTTYYYQAAATNVSGLSTGAVLNFVTLSTNSALSALVANVGTLTPAFAAGTGTYWTGVSNGVTNMTITATVAQSNATVKVNGTTVASGTASGWISLVVGTSSIPVEVTAQDGTTITTYTVAVIREGRAPVFTTLAASLIGSNVVTLSVSMTPYDLPTGSFFQYGTVTNLTGVTFSTLMDGVWNGMAPVAITNLVTELIPDATYYYRAGVTNRMGTNYSDILSFRTLPVNRAPELAVGITNLVATYNSAFSYTFLAGTFTDPDNNTLTYTAYGLPGGITLNSGTRTFSGTPTAAGTNWVTLVANDSYLNATNRFAIVVNKAAGTVTLATLAQTYTGSALPITTWTTPSNLTVVVAYNGGSAALTNAGSYPVTGTLNEANYMGSASNLLVIAKATPTVTNWPVASTIRSGQTLSASVLSGGLASVPGGYSFKLPATVPPPGPYSAAVVFTPT